MTDDELQGRNRLDNAKRLAQEAKHEIAIAARLLTIKQPSIWLLETAIDNLNASILGIRNVEAVLGPRRE